MKHLPLLLLLSLTSFAQNMPDFSRFTSVWVINKNSDPKNWATDEIRATDERSPFFGFPGKDLTLFIPVWNDVIRHGRSEFIQAYLINNAPETVSIDRCDATVYPAETQIYVNGEWKQFQISEGSTCGNSYFQADLPPKSYYLLYITRPPIGDIATRFRLKLTLQGKVYYSNPCSVFLSEKDIAKTGTEIKRF